MNNSLISSEDRLGPPNLETNVGAGFTPRYQNLNNPGVKSLPQGFVEWEEYDFSRSSVISVR